MQHISLHTDLCQFNPFSHAKSHGVCLRSQTLHSSLSLPPSLSLPMRVCLVLLNQKFDELHRKERAQEILKQRISLFGVQRICLPKFLLQPETSN